MSSQVTTFHIPGAPAELLARINARRNRIPAGLMMSAAAPEGAGTDTAAQQQAAATPPATPPASTPPAEGTPPAAAATPPANETDSDKIARLERDLAAARGEAGKSRVNAKAAAAEEARATLAQEIGKALGLVADDKTKVDPAQLAQQLEQSRGDSRDRAAELVVWRNATTLGVNAAALTDSRAFAAAIAKLDASADTFADDVKKAAQEAATQNPLLKAQAAGGKSGADFSGGTGEQQAKPTTLEDAIAAKLGVPRS